MSHAHPPAHEEELDQPTTSTTAVVFGLLVFCAFGIFFWSHTLHALNDTSARWAMAMDTSWSETRTTTAPDAAKLQEAMKSSVDAFAQQRSAAKAAPVVQEASKPEKKAGPKK